MKDVKCFAITECKDDKTEVNCAVCFSKATAAHYYSKGMYMVHAICGEEGYGQPVIYNHCLKF